MAEKAKIATMWLAGCSGCHLSIADIHEAIIDVMGSGRHRIHARTHGR